MWIFGYGSLIWRPDFLYQTKALGYLRDFTRRFYQGSPDHRGTIEAPGRVVTLLPAPGEICIGMAYQVAPNEYENILSRLDVREQGGYERATRPIYSPENHSFLCEALVYFATPENPHYLGPASDAEIAAHIVASSGPSGKNSEYLLLLAEALHRFQVQDEHVFSLEKLVREKLSTL